MCKSTFMKKEEKYGLSDADEKYVQENSSILKKELENDEKDDEIVQVTQL